MNKLNEIFISYYRKFNPTEEQEKMASERYSICMNCPNYGSYFRTKDSQWIHKCNDCGCPISAKVFSPLENACPLSKWAEVDTKYFTKQKVEKKLF